MLIVGHRGARNLWAENGLTGFRNLIGLGVEAVEFDIHQAKDGGVVVIHDPTLERTTDARGPVSSLSAAELARVDAGFHFGSGTFRERAGGVPQLAEVVGLVMWTCLLAPAARVPQLQVSVPAAIEQPVSLPAASMVQLRPALVGRLSVSVTPVALPAPLLVTVIR